MLMEMVNWIPAAGLEELWDDIRTSWIAPIFFILLAGYATTLFISFSFRKLMGVVAAAVVASLLIFYSDDLFGGKDATLTGAAGEEAQKINAITQDVAHYAPLDSGTIHLSLSG